MKDMPVMTVVISRLMLVTLAVTHLPSDRVRAVEMLTITPRETAARRWGERPFFRWVEGSRVSRCSGSGWRALPHWCRQGW